MRFREEAISELAVPDLRDVERGLKNDFDQVQLPPTAETVPREDAPSR